MTKDNCKWNEQLAAELITVGVDNGYGRAGFPKSGPLDVSAVSWLELSLICMLDHPSPEHPSFSCRDNPVANPKNKDK